MISFDLKCSSNHVFEVWFRSSADYEVQRGAGQLICPNCGDQEVGKAVMAPAVAAKGNARKSDRASKENASTAVLPVAAMEGVDVARVKELMQALAGEQAKNLKESQWVGDGFADQARAMYYGEAEQRTIHGTTNLREAREMLEEGLPVAPLLVPIAPPDETH